MAKYALVVGVNYKGNKSIDDELEHAIDDATKINNFLIRAGYPDPVLLPESKATWDAVVDNLEDIQKKLKAGDTFLFFFSGHGIQAKEKQLLLPYDVRIQSITEIESGNAIPVEFIEKSTRKPGVQRILLIDACRNPLGKSKSVQGKEGGVSVKGIHNAWKNAPPVSPIGILCSCSPSEYSYEFKKLGAGGFTYALQKLFLQYLQDGLEISLPAINSQIHTIVSQLLETSPSNSSVQNLFYEGHPVVIYPGDKSAQKTPVQQADTSSKGNMISGDRFLEVTEGKYTGEEQEFEIVPRVNMTFCWCPATDSEAWKKMSNGRDYFLEGMPESKALEVSSSKQRRSRVGAGFWVGKYPVTQRQYQAVEGDNPAHFQEEPERAGCPVESVSLNDCFDFARQLSPINSEWEFRLPSGMEWEYAARAGATGVLPKRMLRDSPYSFIVALKNIAWFGLDKEIGTQKVGGKEPNQWGLHDFLGNVREWCAEDDGSVLRGGSWEDSGMSCHLGSEMKEDASFKNATTGFRLVIALTD